MRAVCAFVLAWDVCGHILICVSGELVMVCVCVCVPWQAGLIPCGQTSIVRPNLIYFVCVCVLCVATSCGGGCSNKEGDPPGLLKDGTLCKGTHNRSRGKFLFISFDTVCVFVLISR